MCPRCSYQVRRSHRTLRQRFVYSHVYWCACGYRAYIRRQPVAWVARLADSVRARLRRKVTASSSH